MLLSDVCLSVYLDILVNVKSAFVWLEDYIMAIFCALVTFFTYLQYGGFYKDYLRERKIVKQ